MAWYGREYTVKLGDSKLTDISEYKPLTLYFTILTCNTFDECGNITLCKILAQNKRLTLGNIIMFIDKYDIGKYYSFQDCDIGKYLLPIKMVTL